MSKLSLGLAVVLVSCLAGCAAEPAKDAASSSEDVVGVTDLGELEAAVGLEPGDGGTDEMLHAGACYRALVARSSEVEYEFRRYGNGASYFAKEGSGVNSGAHRPVVCVDRFEGRLPAHSLSGVVLDAILRYDLGRLQRIETLGTDGGRARSLWSFERGTMMKEALTEEESQDTVRRRPFELDVSRAPSVSGRLLSLNVSEVALSNHYTPDVKVGTLRIGGPAAFVAYRYAHRKGEDTGVFTMDDDVGRFQKKAKQFGDAGMRANVLELGRGQLTDGSDTSTTGTRDERITFRATGASNTQAPLAECTRVVDLDGGVFPEFKCTGI